MSISKKIVHSLTGNKDSKYIVMQGQASSNMLHIQIMAPNHPKKTRPYGFIIDVEISEADRDILYSLMKGS